MLLLFDIWGPSQLESGAGGGRGNWGKIFEGRFVILVIGVIVINVVVVVVVVIIVVVVVIVVVVAVIIVVVVDIVVAGHPGSKSA